MSNHSGEFSLSQMGHALGVARSGAYKGQRQGCSTQQAQADAALTERIRLGFEQRGHPYGSPRVYAQLKAQGITGSRRRMARLMPAARREAIAPRRRVPTPQADRQQHSVSHGLAQDFTASAPKRKWWLAMTSIWTDEGWLYLAGVLDLFSRRLVDGALPEHRPAELTQAALEMAILQRQPPAELLHPADQASHYTSHAYQALLAKHRRLAS